MTTVICPNCGMENPGNAVNCGNCRINLIWAFTHIEKQEPTKKSQIEVDSVPIEYLQAEKVIMNGRTDCPSCIRDGTEEDILLDIEDNGEKNAIWGEDDVIVERVVPPEEIGEPFEVYYDYPVSGYGSMKFTESGVSKKSPRGRSEGEKMGCLQLMLLEVIYRTIEKQVTSGTNL